MKFGFAPVQSLPHFDAMLSQGELAESLGYNALWIHEHHYESSMYPSPLMALAGLAGRTERIELGTNMLLLPLYHPLRVAEDGAMLDVLSRGRFRLGVTAGYSAGDLAAFGVEKSQRGSRMAEGMRLIREAWVEDDISWNTEQCQLEHYTIFPKPIRHPSPPIYVGATAPAGLRRVATLGDEFVVSTTELRSHIPKLMARYHDELRACGKDPATKRTVANRIVHVVETAAQGNEAKRFFSRALLRLYDAWGHTNVTALGRSERSISEVCAEHFVIGDAAECIDAVQGYRDLGISELACLMNFGGPDLDKVERSMRLLAERVMPHFA